MTECASRFPVVVVSARRDRELIEEDLREGYISPEGAQRDYGFEAPK
jgi:N-methylhydantoinase B/oxoprolinase/acetone carboxylase alpha subunit